MMVSSGLKAGVRILGLKPEMLLGLMIARDVFHQMGFDFLITSIMDGTHKRSSEHYTGNGSDVRSKHIPPDRKPQLMLNLRSALGGDFDVILEAEGKDWEHIHVEFDPKLSYQG